MLVRNNRMKRRKRVKFKVDLNHVRNYLKITYHFSFCSNWCFVNWFKHLLTNNFAFQLHPQLSSEKTPGTPKISAWLYILIDVMLWFYDIRSTLKKPSHNYPKRLYCHLVFNEIVLVLHWNIGGFIQSHRFYEKKKTLETIDCTKSQQLLVSWSSGGGWVSEWVSENDLTNFTKYTCVILMYIVQKQTTNSNNVNVDNIHIVYTYIRAI